MERPEALAKSIHLHHARRAMNQQYGWNCSLSGVVVASLIACTGAQATSPKAARVESGDILKSTGDTALGEPINGPGRPILHSDLPLLPRVLTSFGAATHGDALYVLGGYFGRPHAYSKAGQSGALYRMDASSRWQKLAGVEPLQSVTLVAYRDSLIRVGGMRALNEPGDPPRMVSIAEVQRFLPRDNKWQPLPDLPVARSSHDAIVIGDTLYVFGGWRLNEHEWGDADWQNTALSLDLRSANATWQEFEVPFVRRAVGVASTAHHVFVIGGMDTDDEHSSVVNIFDLRTRTWRRGPDYPGSGFGIATIAVGDVVYANGMDGVVRTLRVDSDAWTDAGTLLSPRYFHRLVPGQEGSLLAVGGITRGAGRVRSIETIATDANLSGKKHWRLLRWTLDAPGPAKQRQAAFVHNHHLYLYGGNNSVESRQYEPENFIANGHKLSLSALTWKDIASYPVRRQSVRTAVRERSGTVLAVGGYGNDDDDHRPYNDTFVLDIEDDKWTRRTDTLAKPRTQFELAVHDDRAYLFGGFEFDPVASDYTLATTVVSTSLHEANAPFVDAGITLPRPRRAFAGAQLGNQFYLVGGMDKLFHMVAPADVYDFQTQTWSTIPAPKHARISPKLVATADKLYLAGGSMLSADRELVHVPSVEMYDPRTNAWTTIVETLPIDTSYISMFAYRGRLLIYSALNETNAVELLFIDPPSTAVPSTKDLHRGSNP